VAQTDQAVVSAVEQPGDVLCAAEGRVDGRGIPAANVDGAAAMARRVTTMSSASEIVGFWTTITS